MSSVRLEHPLPVEAGLVQSCVLCASFGDDGTLSVWVDCFFSVWVDCFFPGASVIMLESVWDPCRGDPGWLPLLMPIGLDPSWSRAGVSLREAFSRGHEYRVHNRRVLRTVSYHEVLADGLVTPAFLDAAVLAVGDPASLFLSLQVMGS